MQRIQTMIGQAQAIEKKNTWTFMYINSYSSNRAVMEHHPLNRAVMEHHPLNRAVMGHHPRNSGCNI